ncbi:MAG: DNA alkylation repair protein [Anaerolineae bacterium]
MNLAEIMLELESLGSEQTRKTYRRHGAQDNLFGVSYASFKLLVKKIKQDHGLAQQLWATGNYDAQILAAMIADPRQVDDALADLWIMDVSNYGLSDEFANLMAKAPIARAKAEQWIQSDEEYVARAGWHILSRLSLDNAALDDTYFVPHLATIEQHIHERKNRTREAMNNAVIAFGARAGLQERALLAAKTIGKVHIDHGDTSCKTPDAAQYILKRAARQQPVK